MKAIKIPIQPHSHFHFGEFKVDGNLALSTTSLFAHSDTLFSALVSTYADAIEDADAFVEKFINENLKISSLFYYLEKNDQTIYLLPKPIFIDMYSPRDGNHKLRAAVKFISLKVWEKGFGANEWFTLDNKEYRFIQNNEIVITSEEFKAFGLNEKDVLFNVVDVPKSPIRKSDEKEAIYYQTDIEIAAIKGVQIGFYFLTEADCTENFNQLMQVANIMSFAGIGGEKNNSGRQMDLPREVDFILDVNEPNNFCNLSVFNPSGQDELDNTIYQQSFFRGGNEYSSSEKVKIVRMIKEGALFSSNQVKGNVPVIGTDREGHSILRYGKAFLIPVKFNDYGNN